jgi:hypothetical protein
MQQDLSPQIFVAVARRPGSATRRLRSALASLEPRLGVRFVYGDDLPTASTQRARKVIADAALTLVDATEWNPNVALEYGLSSGLGKPTFLLLDAEHALERGLPYEVTGEPIIHFVSAGDLADRVEEVVVRQLGSTRRREPQETGPDLILADAKRQIAPVVIEYVARGDTTGLKEFATAVRRDFQRGTSSLARRYESGLPFTSDDPQLSDLVDQYLALILPLIDHRSETLQTEAVALGRLAGGMFGENAHSPWSRLPQWLAWWVTYAAGAFAVLVGNLSAVRVLFDTPVRSEEQRGFTLGTLLPGPAAYALDTLPELAGRIDKPLQHLIDGLSRSSFLESYYPDLVRRPAGPVPWITGYNFYVSLLAGQRHRTPLVMSWPLYFDGAQEVVGQLNLDVEYRMRVAREIFQVPLSVFEASAPVWLDSAIRLGTIPGGFNHARAALAFDGSVPSPDT